MLKIYLDPGHGGNDTGDIANGLIEKNLTLQIAEHLKTYLLKNYQDVAIKQSRTGDSTMSIKDRTDKATQWGADFYLSIHVDVSGEGFASYIAEGYSANKRRTISLRSILHDKVIVEMNWLDNGKKEGDLPVLNNLTMPAVLTKIGFMDHQSEFTVLGDNDWLDRVAISHAKGIAKAFNLKYNVQMLRDDPFYRVVIGMFIDECTAQKKVELLRKRGFDGYILPFNNQKERYYRVIVGAFRKYDHATKRVKELKDIGINSLIVEV